MLRRSNFTAKATERHWSVLSWVLGVWTELSLYSRKFRETGRKCLNSFYRRSLLPVRECGLVIGGLLINGWVETGPQEHAHSFTMLQYHVGRFPRHHRRCCCLLFCFVKSWFNLSLIHLISVMSFWPPQWQSPRSWGQPLPPSWSVSTQHEPKPHWASLNGCRLQVGMWGNSLEAQGPPIHSPWVGGPLPCLPEATALPWVVPSRLLEDGIIRSLLRTGLTRPRVIWWYALDCGWTDPSWSCCWLHGWLYTSYFLSLCLFTE